jgi:hypothetical protein
MKYFFFIMIAATITSGCNKNNECPDGTDIGCGCYNTGNPSEPGTSNGWTPAYWNSSTQECYWINNLGNFNNIDKRHCTCR